MKFFKDIIMTDTVIRTYNNLKNNFFGLVQKEFRRDKKKKYKKKKQKF